MHYCLHGCRSMYEHQYSERGRGRGWEGDPDVKRVGMGEERFISKEAELIKKSQLYCILFNFSTRMRHKR